MIFIFTKNKRMYNIHIKYTIAFSNNKTITMQYNSIVYIRIILYLLKLSLLFREIYLFCKIKINKNRVVIQIFIMLLIMFVVQDVRMI